MINYILPFLIFISLGVIIYIVGKHLPEFKKNSQKSLESEKDIKDQKAIDRFKNFFYKIGIALKNGFFSLIEGILKKIKQFLHLIHFWVLKIKKGNNGEDAISRENEIKKELIESEEQNLEKIIEDDLSKNIEVDIKKEIFVSDEVVVVKEEVVVNEKIEEVIEPVALEIEKEESTIENKQEQLKEIDETEEKIESFFSEEAKKIEESGNLDEKRKISLAAVLGLFGRFKKKFKKAGTEDPLIEKGADFSNDDSFSDGIVKVTDSDHGMSSVNESSLIKEVVSVAKKDPMDIDDEIGVDRSILEKKFVQKIANNPKDVENYRKLGELYIKMKSFSDAEECYKQILKFQLRDVDAKRKMEKIKLLKRMG